MPTGNHAGRPRLPGCAASADATGGALFPNAEVVVAAAELELWFSEGTI